MGIHTSMAPTETPVLRYKGQDVFGRGAFAVFDRPGVYSFVAPMTGRIRVRVQGAASSGAACVVVSNNGISQNAMAGAVGGAAGGLAIKEINVTLGDTFVVTVPAGGAPARAERQGTTYGVTLVNGNPGGVASFGAACSATGGSAAIAQGVQAAGGAVSIAASVPGAGVGGDVNYSGGPGGEVTGFGGSGSGCASVATGGGSPPFIWGPGYSGGQILLTGTLPTAGSVRSIATGGAGIGGPGGRVAIPWSDMIYPTSNDGIATGGGSSLEAGRDWPLAIGSSGATNAGASSKAALPATIAGPGDVQPEPSAVSRWLGDVLTGGGSNGVCVEPQSGSDQFSDNRSGVGAGVGGLVSRSSSYVFSMVGANAGPLGATGGVARSGYPSGVSASAVWSGRAGVGAGSGGAAIAAAANNGLTPGAVAATSGQAGHGFVIVEW